MLQVNKLYKFENLTELEKDFGWSLGRYNVGQYNKELYIKDYTEEAVKITQELYEADFVNFEYSTNFKETLEEK